MRLIYLLLRVLLPGSIYGIVVPLAILGTRRELRSCSPEIVGNLHYGANYIDAKNLVIWYFVRTNVDLEKAKENGLEQEVKAKTQTSLAHYGYPKSVLSEIHIGMESRENVNKGGGEWQYFH